MWPLSLSLDDFYTDTAAEVRRALQTLSTALVVDEEANTVRPHLHVQSTTPPPSAAAAAAADDDVVAEKKYLTMQEVRQVTMKEVGELRLGDDELTSIMEVGFKHMLLSHYRNQLLHWFVPEAMLALSLSSNGDYDTTTCKLVISSPSPHPSPILWVGPAYSFAKI